MTQFPDHFVWGAATSAYQIEGAAAEDGRAPSIWDTFSHTPGNTHNGATGDVACDHYHRFPQDLDLLAGLGLHAYRFSIAWPRVQPSGSGPLNPAGMDFYRRLIDGLHQRNIQPAVTLYHWDLPQALQDQGGWQSRTTAERFAEYASQMYAAFGADVTTWITHNEPWVAAFVGHYQGRHAPGWHDFTSALRAGHHLLLSHGLAAQAFETYRRPASQLGITLNLTPAHPATANPADQAAARRVDGYNNRWFLDPLLRGAYPEDLRAAYAEAGLLPEECSSAADLALINAPLDFLGINFYFPERVREAASDHPLRVEQTPPPGETSVRGWEVAPHAFTDLLQRVHRDYGPIPIFITENGAAFADPPLINGQIDDGPRLTYIHTHLAAVQRAIASGVPVKGYYVWSLLDNFEWGEGYAERFGIIGVDFATQQRTLKRSAHWYRQIVAQNGLPELPPELHELAARFETHHFLSEPIQFAPRSVD